MSDEDSGARKRKETEERQPHPASKRTTTRPEVKGITRQEKNRERETDKYEILLILQVKRKQVL